MKSHENIHKLEEGNSYSFNIMRIIEMPPDGEEQYVLESEQGYKYLLKKKLYAHYNLAVGQSIICKIDKVNCSGRIFLEPDHPGCSSGDILDFTITGQKEIINSFGEKETLLVLHDPWGQIAHLNVAGNNSSFIKSTIACKVERIKKGNLLISNNLIYYFGENDIPDPKQPFLISGIITLAENLEFFILLQGKTMHYLRTKYYSKYNFTKGKEINCRLLSYPSLYGHYLEPVHPFYETGKVYTFDFIRTEKPAEISEIPHYLIVVRDLMGHEYTLVREGQEPAWINTVKARVTDIRMSKCILEITEIQ